MTKALALQLLVQISDLFLRAIKSDLEYSIANKAIKPEAAGGMMQCVVQAGIDITDITTNPRSGLENIDAHRLSSNNRRIWILRERSLSVADRLYASREEEKLLFGLRLFTLFGNYLTQAGEDEGAQKSGLLLEWFDTNISHIQDNRGKEVPRESSSPGVDILPAYVRDHIQQLTHGLKIYAAVTLTKEVMEICQKSRHHGQEISLLAKVLFSDQDIHEDLDISENDQRFMIYRILSIINLNG